MNILDPEEGNQIH